MTSSSGLDIGATGMQGWRLEMEDMHITVDMPSLPSHTFLAVFDGHGGAGSAIFAEKHMVEIIEQTPQWKKYLASGATDMQSLGESLIQAFLDIDVALRKYQASTMGVDISGCTSVTAIITPDLIMCANAGDSRCIIGTDGEARYLSQDHKPYDLVERTRIVNAGGNVFNDRVDGDLAVSRALGDFQWKSRSDLKPEQQRVSCFPDIMIHERKPVDEILVLACDGLWDVFSNDDVVSMALDLFRNGESNMVLISEELVDMALNKGSRDNISVITVKLPGAKIGSAELGGVTKRRADRNRDYYAEFNQFAPSPYPGGNENSKFNDDYDNEKYNDYK
eukprot:CAMPEP_0196766928 /NCGR_PEP_ID=MMETSP1095-20130614/32909_1 /TAXON_ID=96789 ORGANISM="Chromulina nebulosa, Strain UTEXLB2642" /NCGR_SAMPLE_ID=MMETSP1095 /ASSEMBLY_ACC=CAM_ASM_000446 /LENGTH=334 /DNA_ID=CAMNT_0042131993 /DNA_START=108 /DNA_END=1112 /DNA_ORIENTATION=-